MGAALLVRPPWLDTLDSINTALPSQEETVRVITVRGHLGSYYREIARDLAWRWHARLITDQEFHAEVGRELEVAVQDIEALEKAPITFRERILNALRVGLAWSSPGMGWGTLGAPSAYSLEALAAARRMWDKTMYLRALERVVQGFVSGGRVVLTGKGTQVILKALPQAFHVFITAPPEVRVRRVMEREAMQEVGARRLIREAGQRRAAFVKRCFGVDAESVGLYDLVLSTGRVSVAGAVEAILQQVNTGGLGATA